MSKKKILVTLQPSLKELVHHHMERTLAEAGYEMKTRYSWDPLEEAEIKEAAGDVHGFIVGLEKVSPAVMDAAPNLKVVSKYGVGTDNIDIPAAMERGISVSNCPGSNSNAVAEVTVGLMLNLARNVQNLCNDLRNKQFGVYVGSELAGKTVGILGFGNIGRKVASYLKPFGTRTLAYDLYQDRKAAEELGLQFASLEEIFAQADFISVHLPLTKETNHLVDMKLLSTVKPGLFLVNIARGGVVAEEALFQAVQEGLVARAAVDVFEFEPPTGSKLLEDDRFIVTPHIGAGTLEATFNMANMSMENVISVIEGKGNPHPVGGSK
jgi:D-3-phosphoglycerate dehydrogenase / 2-oxoglutarate reductase